MDHFPSGDGVKWTIFHQVAAVKWNACLRKETHGESGKQTKDTRNQKGGECQPDTQTNKRTHNRADKQNNNQTDKPMSKQTNNQEDKKTDRSTARRLEGRD